MRPLRLCEQYLLQQTKQKKSFALPAPLREIPQKNGVHGVQNQITKFTMTIINHSLSTSKRSRAPHPALNVAPHFSHFVWHKPPENPPSKGRRGMSLPQNKTLLISKIKTIPRIKVQDKKSLCAPCAFASNSPIKWGAWGAKSNNKIHNDTYKSFIINKQTLSLSAPRTECRTPFLAFL